MSSQGFKYGPFSSEIEEGNKSARSSAPVFDFCCIFPSFILHVRGADFVNAWYFLAASATV